MCIGWAAAGVANIVGIAGGAIGGVAAGTITWKMTARRTVGRALSALDRMRDVAEEERHDA